MTGFRIGTLVCLIVVLPATGLAQPRCDDSRLEEAAGTYDLGLFAQTLGLLKPCLPEGFPGKPQRTSAYELMALSYIATDSLEHARRWVKLLLSVDARYDPDPGVAPPLLVDYVRDLRPPWYTWLWKGNAWYHWAGRGAVIGSVVSIPFLLRGNSAPELPGPPAFPPQ